MRLCTYSFPICLSNEYKVLAVASSDFSRDILDLHTVKWLAVCGVGKCNKSLTDGAWHLVYTRVQSLAEKR